jgi:chromosomal replication initiation ATPase DnaA
MSAATPIEWIFEAGCKAVGATPADMRGPCRKPWFSRRRKFIARKMRDERYSYPDIAKQFGGRHHTTVMCWLGVVKATRVKRKRTAAAPAAKESA